MPQRKGKPQDLNRLAFSIVRDATDDDCAAAQVVADMTEEE